MRESRTLDYKRDWLSVRDALAVAAKALRGASNDHLHAPQVNLDGVMCQTHCEDRGDYVQLYRNGAVELAYGRICFFRSPLDNTNSESLFPEQYEKPLVHQGWPAIFETLAALEVAPPAYLMFSWLQLPAIWVPHGRHILQRRLPDDGEGERRISGPCLVRLRRTCGLWTETWLLA
jgi:hypothetical protein